MKSKKSRLSKNGAKKSNALSIKRFIFSYLILMGTFFSLLKFRPIESVGKTYDMYRLSIAFLTSKVVGLMGIPSTYQGSVIQLPSISLDVRFGCDGFEAMIIYSVAIVTFPATWKDKALGIVVGFFMIQVINVLRIVSLAYSGVYYRDIFEVIHVYVAQGIMIAVSLGVFLLYLNYVNGEKRGSLLKVLH